MSSARTKDDLRADARKARASLSEAARDMAGKRAYRRLADTFDFEGRTVSAYWPLGDEIDPRPFMNWADGQGISLCLPVVTARKAPLAFRAWSAGDTLEEGPFDTRHPGPDAPECMPDMLLVPLLAFTRQGGRLGYGGGFFDRTLGNLRENKAIQAIGLAYAVQEVPKLPADAHDQPLDWVVTEQEVINCGGGA